MNKILKTIVATAAFMSFAGGAAAQSHYYHLVGDTVYGRSPIYYYDWWPQVDSLGLLPDSALYCRYPIINFFLHTTSDTLKVIGIASAMSYMNIADQNNQYEECDTTMDTAMHYVLYKATPGGPVELARVCWTADYNNHPLRYMALPSTYSKNDGDNYCDDLYATYDITSLREYYFDAPVFVTDSFYLGWEHLHRISLVNSVQYFTYSVNHNPNYATLYQYRATADCTVKIPARRHMYRLIPSSDTSWKYREENLYPTVFLIIEIDTTGVPYDTSLFSCPAPERPTITARDNYWARIQWEDNNNQDWTVSVVPLGGNPDNGRMIQTPSKHLVINGLYPDTSYNVYVKGMCHPLIGDTYWGEWSDPGTIDSVQTEDPHEGIATPGVTVFSLSPNPASGTVTVTTEARQGTLAIVDLQGRQMLSQSLAGKETVVDIRTLAAGTYIVILTTPRGQTSQKLTVE